MKKQLYQTGKMKPLVERVAVWAAQNPDIVVKNLFAKDDFQELHALISSKVEGYGRKDVCFNCGHHMKLAVYTAGVMEGMLLFAMARHVRESVRAGKSFTEANMVHVPTLGVSDATRHSVTRASYLGLVAQPSNKRGSGYWVVTHWGWRLLRGDSLPRHATYWRGKLLERSVEVGTLSDVFKTHVDLVQKAVARRRAVESDFRAQINDYKPSEWTGFGGFAEDVLPKKETTPTDAPEEVWWNKD